MNKFTLALALISGVAAVPTAAMAIEPYLPKSPKVFAKLDIDSNGKISADELRPKAEKRFLRLDSDKDGAVSSAEIDAALQKSLEARRSRILKLMDADSNGSITKAELDDVVAKMLAAADSDGDGGVTLDEIRKYRVAKLHKTATGESSN
jgi:Ca2+-binding EF-hand superfamily protein